MTLAIEWDEKKNKSRSNHSEHFTIDLESDTFILKYYVVFESKVIYIYIFLYK